MEESELDLANLPTDVDKLQLLVSDLTRRLQNSLHMVEAQKRLVSNATNTSDMLRTRINSLSNKLKLEIAKNETLQNQKVKEEESTRFDQYKKKATKLNEELRMALLDHSMQPIRKEPNRITKMRKNLEDIESKQDSQKLLLQHINEREKLIETLSNACQHGEIDKCRLLVRKGANVNEIDSAGFLPVHYACANGFTDIVRLLLEYGSDVTSYLSGYAPLGIASQNGHYEVVRVLVEFGGNVEEKGKGGSPPIVLAAANNRVECVSTLLDLGANVNSCDLNTDTPLHAAVKLDEPDAMIRLLLNHEADTNAKNRQGQTPVKLGLSVMNVSALNALGYRTVPAAKTVTSTVHLVNSNASITGESLDRARSIVSELSI